MDPKFRSSFIPKKPLTTGSVPVKTRRFSLGIIMIISVVIFLISAGASSFLFGYQLVLKDRIDKKGIELESARNKIDSSFIDSIKRFNDRLNVASILLSDHTTASAFFAFLEENTLRNIEFNSLGYSFSDTNEIMVTMQGKASGYNSLVLQSDVFAHSDMLRNPVTSGIELDDSGKVGFTIDAILNKPLLKYEADEFFDDNLELDTFNEEFQSQ